MVDALGPCARTMRRSRQRRPGSQVGSGALRRQPSYRRAPLTCAREDRQLEGVSRSIASRGTRSASAIRSMLSIEMFRSARSTPPM